jgi:hypothetical protein
VDAREEKTVNEPKDPTQNGYLRNSMSIAGAGLMLASLFGGLLFAALELPAVGPAAVSAVGGFAFLSFAMVGVEVLT